MVMISANISKKAPIPGTEFSSQQYGAAMEIEVSDADQPENIQVRIRELYQALSVAIDEQIAAATQGGPVSSTALPAPTVNRQYAPPSPPPQPAPAGRTGYDASNPTGRGNGNGGNGRKTDATEAQQRAIYAICKSLPPPWSFSGGQVLRSSKLNLAHLAVEVMVVINRPPRRTFSGGPVRQVCGCSLPFWPWWDLPSPGSPPPVSAA